MREARRQKITYANVMSTIAVLLVVGGGATAIAAVVLAKNSVKSRHIARGAVKTSDLGRNAATGAKVKESTLGQVPSAAQATSATNATNATNAANAGLLDGTDSLGFARPAGVEGEFSEGAPLTLNVPGYVTFSISCDDNPSGDPFDAILFQYSPLLGPTSLQTATTALADSQGSPASVQVYGGPGSGGGQSDPNNVGSIVYRLHEGNKGVAVFAQGHEIFGSPNCEGSIQAFRIG